MGTSTSACNATQLNSKPITEFGLHCGESVDVFLRPMKGDHIHYAFVTYIDGKMLGIPYDVAPLTSPYEGKPLPPLVEVTKRFDYHIAQVVSVHSFVRLSFSIEKIRLNISKLFTTFSFSPFQSGRTLAYTVATLDGLDTASFIFTSARLGTGTSALFVILI